MKTIFIGNDHRGFSLASKLVEYLSSEYNVKHAGTTNSIRCDYPLFANKVCVGVLDIPDSVGILVCGSGIGMSMAANRNKGIRCALCRSENDAKMSRIHNNANIIAIGSDTLDIDWAKKIVDIFLPTNFSNDDVYEKRNIMLDQKN